MNPKQPPNPEAATLIASPEVKAAYREAEVAIVALAKAISTATKTPLDQAWFVIKFHAPRLVDNAQIRHGRERLGMPE